MQVSNQEFLEAIFGDEWEKAHVTSFPDDPSNIPVERRGFCWAGGPASRLLHNMVGNENQYFTISLFQKGRRRCGEFDACFVIVADDVGEKVPYERVELLPEPSYKLRTSEGSEQWGWLLDPVEEDRWRVERLLEGLIKEGLVPSGKDPGMRGVTRYVRLPEGINTKTGRNNFNCVIESWRPDLFTSVDSLAAAFDIDLTERPRELVLPSGGGVGEFPNHPIWKEVIVTGHGADGWVRIDCPNSAEHSTDDPSGAAVRTMIDGSVQFVCHHGHCEDITGGKLVGMLGSDVEAAVDRFKADIALVGLEQLEKKLGGLESFGSGEVSLGKPLEESCGVEEVNTFEDPEEEFNDLEFDRKRYIYIAAENKFWDCKTLQLISLSGLDNRYLARIPKNKGKGVSEKLLQAMTVDDEADDFCWEPTGWHKPKRAELVRRINGRRSINMWSGVAHPPRRNIDPSKLDWDCGLWLKHAEFLLPDQGERRVVLDYLACMVQRLAVKPSFWIIHRGSHGVGKDIFYRALVEGLGDNIARSTTVDNVTGSWGNYLAQLKFCIIEEIDKQQDKKIANAMKTLCASGASRYRTLNLKGGDVIRQLDCLGGVMMSNKRACLAVEQGERRFFVVDSYHDGKGREYYQKLDEWYRKGGIQKVMDYLSVRDISAFDHNSLPWVTDACKELVKTGKYDYEQNIEESADAKAGVFEQRFISVLAMRRYAEHQKWRCGLNGIQETMENLGFKKIKIQKKIDGKNHPLGHYWIRKEDQDLRVTELFDLIHDQSSGKITTFR